MPLPRFQFRVRTLFVVVTIVAVACALYGYVWRQHRIATDRAAFRRNHPEFQIIPSSVDVSEWPFTFGDSSRPPDVSWPRKRFGDESVVLVVYPQRGRADDVQKARELYPEAKFFEAIGSPDAPRQEKPKATPCG